MMRALTNIPVICKYSSRYPLDLEGIVEDVKEAYRKNGINIIVIDVDSFDSINRTSVIGVISDYCFTMYAVKEDNNLIPNSNIIRVTRKFKIRLTEEEAKNLDADVIRSCCPHLKFKDFEIISASLISEEEKIRKMSLNQRVRLEAVTAKHNKLYSVLLSYTIKSV